MYPQGEDVLSTKLHVPRPPPTYVARDRLAALVDRGLDRPGLTLLCAPAGFGKSALVADRCARRGPSATAWLSVDRADNDPIRFWRHLSAALDLAAGDDSQLVDVVDRAAMGESAPDGQAVVTALINAMAGERSEVAVVLDDYHVIETDAIHDGVRLLIHHAPPALRIVIATRADPPLQLARLRSQGRLTEIRAADLRFDEAESRELLRALTGADIEPPVVAELTARTEGWVAGLQLAGLSIEGGVGVDSIVASFTGEHRFVIDYLAEEVLDRQPAEMRDFLLRTSILDRLCGPLCDAVTGQDHGQRTLEAIEAANLFLVPLDDHRRWWRYHQLFADLLRVRLQRQPERAVADLHRRAAGWHRDHGDVDRAIHHTWESGDGAGVVQLIEANADALLLRREGATLQRWFDRLPAELTDSRRLVLARARIAVYGGRLDEAEQLLDRADGLAPDRGGPEAEAAGGQPVGPLRDLEPTTVLLRAFVAHLRGRADEAVELAASVVAEVGHDSSIGLIAGWHLASGPWLLGAVDEAEPALTANVGAWRRLGHPDRAALSAQRVGRIQQARGDLDAALQTYRNILENDAALVGPDAPAAGAAHVGIAEVAYQRNDLDTARVHARLGISMGTEFIYTQQLAAGWAILARIAAAQGSSDEARDAMATALGLAPVSDVVDLLNPVPAQMAQLAVATGDLEAAARWARTRGLEPSADAVAMHQYQPATLARSRLLIARGEPGPALAGLDRLRDLAASQGRLGSLLEIELLRALALDATGDDAAALDALSRSLDLAIPQGYVRVFADEGEPMAELLERLRGRAGASDDGPGAAIDALIAACRPAQPSGPGDRPPAARLVVPLTERELEVLALLVDGKPNRDVAAELFISLNTVKKHVTHIFDKLGVTNRTAAASRARDLGLVP